MAEPFLCCNEVMEAHWGAPRQRAQGRAPARRAGRRRQCSGPGLRGPEGCNSRARLWVPGAQARLWLLSRQNFPELRCCLDSPAERRQLSQQGHGGRLSLRGGTTPALRSGCPVAWQWPAQGTGPARAPTVPPASHFCGSSGHGGMRLGQDNRHPQGHLPCFPWPRCLLGALCVLGGQRPPGRVGRNQPHVPWMPDTGQDSGGAGARDSPPMSAEQSWEAGPPRSLTGEPIRWSSSEGAGFSGERLPSLALQGTGEVMPQVV